MDREEVRRAIQRVIHYPRLARRRGIEGTVTVRFRILADGTPSQLSVVASADPLLAEAALDAVRRAAPFSTAPGWVRVPVVFAAEK